MPIVATVPTTSSAGCVSTRSRRDSAPAALAIALVLPALGVSGVVNAGGLASQRSPDTPLITTAAARTALVQEFAQVHMAERPIVQSGAHEVIHGAGAVGRIVGVRTCIAVEHADLEAFRFNCA